MFGKLDRGRKCAVCPSCWLGGAGEPEMGSGRWDTGAAPLFLAQVWGRSSGAVGWKEAEPVPGTLLSTFFQLSGGVCCAPAE